MRHPQADRAFRLFARQQALFGRFNPVVDGVAQQVGERRFEFFEDIAVNLGFLAFDFQAYLLAQRPTQITDHALLAHQHIGERAHAAGQRGVIEQLRALAGLPAEFVEFGGLLAEQMLRLGEHAPGLVQSLFNLVRQAHHFELLVKGVQRPQAGALHTFEPMQRHQIRLETLGFDQRFTRQVEQAIKALGGDAQHSFAAFCQALRPTRRFGGRFGSRWSYGLWL